MTKIFKPDLRLWDVILECDLGMLCGYWPRARTRKEAFTKAKREMKAEGKVFKKCISAKLDVSSL